MFDRIKQMNHKRKEYDEVIKRIARKYGRSKWYFYVDIIINKLINGMGVVYYTSLAMYRLSQIERSHYVGGSKAAKLERVFNTNENKNKIIDDKVKFNELFSDYIHRDWIYAPNASEKDVEAFLKNNEYFIVKSPYTNMGKGVYKSSATEAFKDFPGFIHNIREGKQLLEGFINQHHEMSAINPTSVNTIRVVTAKDSVGKVHIIGTSLRAGGLNQVVDNFSAGGVQYPIDPETGIVIGGGVMHDGTRNVYYHPATNKQVIGFKVPNWDCVISTVKETAAHLDNIRYVGWDIAITENGCDLVEANINQGSNGMQLDGVGKYRIIMQYR